MSRVIRFTLLSLSLVAGAAFAAHAQSNNIAALPPGSAVTPSAPVGAATSAAAVGVPAGSVAASPRYVGPSPGVGYYGYDPAFEKTSEHEARMN